MTSDSGPITVEKCLEAVENGELPIILNLHNGTVFWVRLEFEDDAPLTADDQGTRQEWTALTLIHMGVAAGILGADDGG